MRKKSIRKNKGYTLIEMIIVIGIIAIISGMSFVTIGIIKRAKCNAAATTIDSQMSTLLLKTKALSEAKGSRLCMMIVHNDNDLTYEDGTFAKADSYSIVLGYDKGTSFNEKAAEDNGDVETLPDIRVAEATLPNILDIRYTPEAGAASSSLADGTNTMLIEFDKATGSVRYGAGTYEIVLNGDTVATVRLDSATGTHSVK